VVLKPLVAIQRDDIDRSPVEFISVPVLLRSYHPSLLNDRHSDDVGDWDQPSRFLRRREHTGKISSLRRDETKSDN